MTLEISEPPRARWPHHAPPCYSAFKTTDAGCSPAKSTATPKAGRGGSKSLVARNVNVRVFGAAVQVDAEFHYERPDGTAGVSRYIDAYHWRDCRWQVISAQITAVPAPSS